MGEARDLRGLEEVAAVIFVSGHVWGRVRVVGVVGVVDCEMKVWRWTPWMDAILTRLTRVGTKCFGWWMNMCYGF